MAACCSWIRTWPASSLLGLRPSPQKPKSAGRFALGVLHGSGAKWGSRSPASAAYVVRSPPLLTTSLRRDPPEGSAPSYGPPPVGSLRVYDPPLNFVPAAACGELTAVALRCAGSRLLPAARRAILSIDRSSPGLTSLNYSDPSPRSQPCTPDISNLLRYRPNLYELSSAPGLTSVALPVKFPLSLADHPCFKGDIP